MGKKTQVRAIVLIVATFMLALAAGCSDKKATAESSVPATGNIDTSSVKGSCDLWTWDSSEKPVVAAFQEIYPDITVNIVPVNYDDYMNKVQTSIASGSKLADILCGEYNFRARLFRMDILENLEEAPYNLDRNEIMDYELPLSTYNGNIVGLEGSITAGGIAYKAPLALKYLDTDSVEELEASLNTWDAIIEAGKKVQVQSGGDVYLFHAWADVQEIFDCAGTEPWTEGNKPTKYLMETMPDERYDVLVRMLEAGVFDPSISDHYTPAMNSAIDGDNHIMIDAATWHSAFVIGPNDKDGQGRWREMVAPTGPFNCGGTAYGITKESENKDAAWSYLKWSFAGVEGGEANVALRNFFPPYKPLIDTHDFSKDVDELFAPQKLTEKFYVDMAPDIQVRPAEFYSNQIKAAFKTVETALINDTSGSFTLERYKELVRTEILNNCPDLEM